MRKMIGIFIICTILFAQNVIAIKNNTELNQEKNLITNDPPDWATGEFNGTWGISIAGVPTLELGWVEGYFDTLGIFGRIEGDFAVWDNQEPTAYISGWIIGYYMLGIIGDYINPDNATFYVGLGAPDEYGLFYYRINLFIGPSWYMQGTWREI